MSRLKNRKKKTRITHTFSPQCPFRDSSRSAPVTIELSKTNYKANGEAKSQSESDIMPPTTKEAVYSPLVSGLAPLDDSHRAEVMMVNFGSVEITRVTRGG